MNQTLKAIQDIFGFGKKKSAPNSGHQPALEHLRTLEDRIKIKFKSKELLEQALTHPSVAAKGKGDNARLEFLGDSIIGLAVSHILYENNPMSNEGELTRWKSHLVSSKFLSELAEALRLGHYLRIGGSEKRFSRPTPSMMEAAFEAFIGALYLDAGFEKTFHFLEELFQAHLKIPEKEEKNPKGLLQEVLQQKYKEQPYYAVIAEKGPPHARIFEIQVLFRGKVFGTGKGRNKKDAEQEAAREALTLLARE